MSNFAQALESSHRREEPLAQATSSRLGETAIGSTSRFRSS